MKTTERVACQMCQGEGYCPEYLPRPDGYFDRVYSPCGACSGAGTFNIVTSDTPLLDYIKRHSDSVQSNT